ncbi:hypothetical protein GOBAR_DD28889 [Gossypium barbadense]|nr:hypothetical protein GOBAR_DD28889 [Gossypium barbadense]
MSPQSSVILAVVFYSGERVWGRRAWYRRNGCCLGVALGRERVDKEVMRCAVRKGRSVRRKVETQPACGRQRFGRRGVFGGTVLLRSVRDGERAGGGGGGGEGSTQFSLLLFLPFLPVRTCRSKTRVTEETVADWPQTASPFVLGSQKLPA